MKGRKCLIVGLVVPVVLCLTTSTALAKDVCQKQNAHIQELGAAIFDPEVCGEYDGGGYDACQFGELVGTLNGTLSFRRMIDWTAFVADDTALVIWADSDIVTKKGELWIQSRCILHLAVHGLACHMAIWGGTGDYADKTGWLALIPTAIASADTAAGGTFLLKGEICPAEE